MINQFKGDRRSDCILLFYYACGDTLEISLVHGILIFEFKPYVSVDLEPAEIFEYWSQNKMRKLVKPSLIIINSYYKHCTNLFIIFI